MRKCPKCGEALVGIEEKAMSPDDLKRKCKMTTFLKVMSILSIIGGGGAALLCIINVIIISSNSGDVAVNTTGMGALNIFIWAVAWAVFRFVPAILPFVWEGNGQIKHILVALILASIGLALSIMYIFISPIFGRAAECINTGYITPLIFIIALAMQLKKAK